MKVYLTFSTSELITDGKSLADQYNTIRSSVLESGHVLTDDWLPNFEQKKNTGKRLALPVEFYGKVIKSITAADVAIFESSVSSMSVGHQLTFALSREKPCLVLATKDSNKSQTMFIRGSKSPYLTIREYKDNEDLKRIVEEFLLEESKNQSVRFNLVIDQRSNRYLNWAAYAYNKSKSDIIRSLIGKAEKSDERYQQEVSAQI